MNDMRWASDSTLTARHSSFILTSKSLSLFKREGDELPLPALVNKAQGNLAPRLLESGAEDGHGYAVFALVPVGRVDSLEVLKPPFSRKLFESLCNLFAGLVRLELSRCVFVYRVVVSILQPL